MKLPTELMLNIVENITLSRSDHYRLCLVSRTLLDVTRPMLYRHPEFITDRSTEEAVSFFTTLSSINTDLASLVHTLSCSLGILDRSTADVVGPHISTALYFLRNLVTLQINFAGPFGPIVESFIVDHHVAPQTTDSREEAAVDLVQHKNRRATPWPRQSLAILTTIQTSSLMLPRLAARRPVKIMEIRRRCGLEELTHSVLPTISLSIGPIHSLSVSVQVESREEVEHVIANIAKWIPSLAYLKVTFSHFYYEDVHDFALAIGPLLSPMRKLAELTTHHTQSSRQGIHLHLDEEYAAIEKFVAHNPSLVRITPIFATWAKDFDGETPPVVAVWTPRPAPFTLLWWIQRYGRERARQEMITRWGGTGAWIPSENQL